MKTLYVSDLDGTLLNEEGQLSEWSRQGLEEVLRRGTMLTVASARSLNSVHALLRPLVFPLPVVSMNGAFVSDMASEEHHHVQTLSPDHVDKMHAAVVAAGLSPFVSTTTAQGDWLYVSEICNPGMAWFLRDRKAEGDTRLREVSDVTVSYREAVTCLSVMGSQEELQVLMERFVSDCGADIRPHLFENLYSPGWYWMTVHSGRATKAFAIQTLMRDAGLDDARLVVFGDHHNDLEMFQLADESIAVANAVEEVKQNANRHIGPNTTDSVVRYLLDVTANAV